MFSLDVRPGLAYAKRMRGFESIAGATRSFLVTETGASHIDVKNLLAAKRDDKKIRPS